MSPPAQIGGIYAALPTPFDDRRSIDQKALEHILDYLLGRPIQGFVLLTEAAEDPVLESEERREIIKIVSAKVKGRKPFWVSISAASTSIAIENAKLAEIQGAQAILLSPARIPGLGYRELYRHVDRVIRSISLPVLLTDRPDNALRSLQSEEVATLASHSDLKGVFIAYESEKSFALWKRRFKDKDPILLGACSLSLSSAMRNGAKGAICGISVIATELAARIWKLVQEGNEAKAAQLESTLSSVVELLGPPSLEENKDNVKKIANKIAARELSAPVVDSIVPFAMIKKTLELQGHPIGADVRAPYENLKPDAVERLKTCLKKAGILS